MKYWALLLWCGLAGLSTVQAQSLITFVVTDTTDAPDVSPGDGQCANSSNRCTLRGAIMEANALAQSDPSREFVIQLRAGTYVLRIGTTQEEYNSGIWRYIYIGGSDSTDAAYDDLDIAAHVTIVGAGRDSTIIELCHEFDTESYTVTNCTFRPFEVLPSASLKLEMMKAMGAFVERGGVVFVHGGATFTLEGVSMENGRADYGGQIYNEGTVTILGSILWDPNADEDGGVIYNTGTLIVENSTFYSGEADHDGGAIYNRGTVMVTNSTFEDNEAGDDGGAIYNAGILSVNTSTFTDNSADDDGGAILNDYSVTAEIADSRFENNDAYYGGGAIANYGSLTIAKSLFRANWAEDYGGAVYDDGQTIIVRSAFLNNEASPDDGGYGGAIYGSPLVMNSTFYGNRAEYDGAISGEPVVVFSTIVANQATGGSEEVGGIDGGVVKNSIVAGNRPMNCDQWDIAAQGINLTDDESCPGFLQVDDVGVVDTLAMDGSLALEATSPALGAAVDCTDSQGNPVVTDQRGILRPQGEACDAGAYELEGVLASPLSVSPGRVVEVGNLEWGTSTTVTFTLTNSGFEPVTLSLEGPFDLGLNGELDVSTTCASGNLNAGASCQLMLRLTPASALGIHGVAVRISTAGTEPLYLLTKANVTIGRTFFVNTTEDIEEPEEAVGDGRCDYDLTQEGDQCSLRAAMQEIYSWDGGTFTIQLQEGATYTSDYTLHLSDYGTIVLEGNGATLSGGVEPEACTSLSWKPLLMIWWGTGEAFTLRNLTLRANCSSTPAIIMDADGALVLENVTVEDNTGGGLYIGAAADSVVIRNSTFRNNRKPEGWDSRGGAVQVDWSERCQRSVFIEGSTFEGNSATNGGALWVGSSCGDEQIVLESSRFIGNTTTEDGEGGAIWVSLPFGEGSEVGPSMLIRNSAILDNSAGSEGGGGIYVGGPCDSGPLKLINVTIAGNSTTGTGGGIDASECDRVDLAFVTITANRASQGGGFYSRGNGQWKRLKGVILAGNTADEGLDCYGPMTSAGGNVIGNGANCDITPQDSDVIGVDEVLAPRDTTAFIYPLVVGSPALDRVTDCTDFDGNVVEVDQRGIRRPQGAACDAGAVEREIPVAADEIQLPISLAFYGHYPNPVRSDRVVLVLDLPVSAQAQVVLYDILGRQLRRWSVGTLMAGTRRQVSLHLGSLAAGLYIYQVQLRLDSGKTQSFQGRLVKLE